ncbi:MAG: endonuclease domain-containing protein [Chloroflexota bacterium]
MVNNNDKKFSAIEESKANTESNAENETTNHSWQTIQPSPQLWQRLKPLARQMRAEPTPAEHKLWQRLRKRQVQGVKFRRQVAIERFIVDFCCFDVRLIIEVDGPIHQYSQEQDAIRQEYLENVGFRVLRFTNEEVLSDIERVVEKIKHEVGLAGGVDSP